MATWTPQQYALWLRQRALGAAKVVALDAVKATKCRCGRETYCAECKDVVRCDHGYLPGRCGFCGAEALHLRPSTDEEKLNKTERAYLQYLRLSGDWCWIGIQCVTLKLADDTRYTPDFFVIGAQSGQIVAKEVKGFFRDDAKVKIKVAARLFPFVTFELVRKNGHGWDVQTVNP